MLKSGFEHLQRLLQLHQAYEEGTGAYITTLKGMIDPKYKKHIDNTELNKLGEEIMISTAQYKSLGEVFEEYDISSDSMAAEVLSRLSNEDEGDASDDDLGEGKEFDNYPFLDRSNKTPRLKD
jgi:hypothetical protein